jgi:hypothetical protein
MVTYDEVYREYRLLSTDDLTPYKQYMVYLIDEQKRVVWDINTNTWVDWVAPSGNGGSSSTTKTVWGADQW